MFLLWALLGDTSVFAPRRYEDYKPEFIFYKLVLILYVSLYYHRS